MGAWRASGDNDIDEWFEDRPAAACPEGAAESARVRAAAVPASARLGWEGSDRHWSGRPLDWELGVLGERESDRRSCAGRSSSSAAASPQP